MDNRRLDAADAKIIALFEQRMALVKKAAANKDKYDLKQEKKQRRNTATDKAVRHACDVETIGYTESLLRLMLCAAESYQRRLLRKSKK